MQNDGKHKRNMGIWKNLFGGNDKESDKSFQNNEQKVEFPEEVFSTIEFKREGLPGVGIITSSLKDFKQREIFPWHLSVIMHYSELMDNGMPSEKEREETNNFIEYLKDLLKGENQAKPNGLFLGRFTWNGTIEFIWKIYDPEVANKALKQIIEEKNHPRPFDYRMGDDNGWELSKWHLMQEK